MRPTTDADREIKLMKFVAVFGFGGTERQFVNLGLALEPSRFSVSFGCMRRWGQFLEEIDARGIPVLEYNVSTFRDPRTLSAQFRLARDIRRRGIQIVHTYNFYANVFAIPAARLAGARVIASIRDMGLYLSPTQRRVQRLVCRLADRMVVNAHAIRDWLVEDGLDGSRITVIPNGIDVTRFERCARTGMLHQELGLPADAALVGVLGRMNRFKGLEDFLCAAAMVSDKFPRARFLIVGDGFTVRERTVVKDTTYQQELARLVAQLGLEDRVIFTGFRPDVERLLPELSVSVLPSLSEGLSNVVLESMAAGVPVVATRVGGTAEAVQHERNGLLVPPGDPDSLANAIGRLLEAPSLAQRLGRAGRHSVTERFSMTRLVDTTSLLYESLLPTNGRDRVPHACPVSPP